MIEKRLEKNSNLDLARDAWKRKGKIHRRPSNHPSNPFFVFKLEKADEKSKEFHNLVKYHRLPIHFIPRISPRKLSREDQWKFNTENSKSKSSVTPNGDRKMAVIETNSIFDTWSHRTQQNDILYDLCLLFDSSYEQLQLEIEIKLSFYSYLLDK